MGTPTVQIYMTTKEKFEKWKNDGLYFVNASYDNSKDIEFITKEQAIQRVEEDSKKYGDGSTFDQLLREWEENGSEDQFFQESDFYSYKHYFDGNREHFSFTKNIVCEHGTLHVIFGYTGW